MHTSESSIWLSANELIKQHGDGAMVETALRYFDMQERGDESGKHVWERVARAIGELTTRGPASQLEGAPTDADLQTLRLNAQAARLRAAIANHDEDRRVMIAVADDCELLIRSQEAKRANEDYRSSSS